MLTQPDTSAVALFIGALLLSAFFGFLYRRKHQLYLLIWSGGWLATSLHFLLFLTPATSGGEKWVIAAREWFPAFAALIFLFSVRLYARQPARFLAVSAAVFFAGAWATLQANGWVSVPQLYKVFLTLLLVLVARAFWELGRKQESRCDRLLGLAFGAWAAIDALLLIQSRVPWLRSANLLPLLMLPQLIAGALMAMAVYEEERRRVERNMLALSNLNLAASTSRSGEVAQMLAQALDRVSNVVRIPAGALVLNYGETDGPISVVTTGLADSFSSGVQTAGLDEYVVKLVARLGGLAVLNDLPSDSKWEALEREGSFRQFRRLLLDQNLRTVVGTSLQSKERVLGLLLLGTPDSRAFTPAELRLLLALGHQIGVAVENSYLTQQTSRRSEELHILNEIGRVLTSTLEMDDLFDKLYGEIRRLFAASNFYIALYDAETQQIRVELDVEENEKRPKSARPVANHLTDHLIRTRQAILIRENFLQEVQRLGLEPRQGAGCFCGVPLVVRDHAIGVMAAFSAQDRVFDEGHLELMRVLAAEAAIAIENARLFSEEQRKSRQLTLLNNISGHAITTLNADEMLSEIVVEMEQALPYDHIGIGVLDYSARELVVEAEGGKIRGAAGRHVALGDGLLGHVARSGQMTVVREATPTTPRLLLAESRAGAALPVVCADQLLGVLYVENRRACDFTEEELTLLRTVTDLFASALHNAQTFQKAQEQAITDGLTGVKTHRFLMEALSAEWKRSTRAGRPFALVLMDLDRFKFVNDFYGHLEGDVVLQRVGHILEQNCRRSDVVARYGGDEFVILMPETSVEQARQLANKLRGWVAADPLLRDKNITASFGIAGYPVHGSTPQELIQIADSSMYLSKHQGGNSVSTAEHCDAEQTRQWKQDVLEAYLGVTLKRMFTTGPEAFREIRERIEQFTHSLNEQALNVPPDQLPPAVVETVTWLALAIDSKNSYTQGHSQKVSAYAVIVGRAAGLPHAEVEELRLAGLLHDIGKVGIPEAILNKSGPLDAAEWEVMKSHALLGAKILEPLPSMNRVGEMVKHHHEFFDGSGYPHRCAGEKIPFGARAIGIADAYDTITSDRTYKKGRNPEAAFAELERCAGSQFDPKLVKIFVEAMRQQPRQILEIAIAAADYSGTTAL